MVVEFTGVEFIDNCERQFGRLGSSRRRCAFYAIFFWTRRSILSEHGIHPRIQLVEFSQQLIVPDIQFIEKLMGRSIEVHSHPSSIQVVYRREAHRILS
ncbi:MAG: hypothetical protein U0892_05195 [Pirellulales bacterium]